MIKDAFISPCGKYRYALWRIWDTSLPLVMFISLNPSKADDNIDDPTIRRCISFSRSWGYGGFSIGNLLALRSPHPQDLWKDKDPIGPENDKWLVTLKAQAAMVVAAWGNNGAFQNRDHTVAGMFSDLYCLKISAKGRPCHPLYVAGKLKPKKISKHSGSAYAITNNFKK